LKKLKGMPDLRRSLLDFMGKDELAGNLFRLTLTEGRIKKDGTRGQDELEDVARHIGARVRKTMIEETGITPESLPITHDIKLVRKNLKSTVKGFTQFDNLEQQRVYEAEEVAVLGAAPDSDYFPDCRECVAGNERSHSGSERCSSGSIASGGVIAHCSCQKCSTILAAHI
jgi:hypothetical protein